MDKIEADDWRLSLKPGDVVLVARDSGFQEPYTVKYEPWQLGHGEWVIGLDGVAGGYLLSRVRSRRG